MKDFKGKVTFITGGASGAGLGQAKVFGREGMKVVIADIRQSAIDSALAELRSEGIECHGIVLDVTNKDQFLAAADEVEAVYGEPPQLLILTAGVNCFGPAECSTFDDYAWVMGVNLGGVINGLVTFVPRMVKAGKGGHVAATASWGGFSGGSITAPYSAAKAAVINLMESYYIALKPYGIGCTVLTPENIRTNIYAASETRPKELGETGYNTDEKTVAFLKAFHANGLDPEELARIFKKGIENEQLIVIPYEDGTERLREIYERWLDYTSPEGMQRIAERDRKRMEEREKADANRTVVADDAMVNSGFGKARAGIDWVNENKRRAKN